MTHTPSLGVALSVASHVCLSLTHCCQGQLGVLSAPYKHLKLGQKVATVVHRYSN